MGRDLVPLAGRHQRWNVRALDRVLDREARRARRGLARRPAPAEASNGKLRFSMTIVKFEPLLIAGAQEHMDVFFREFLGNQSLRPMHQRRDTDAAAD